MLKLFKNPPNEFRPTPIWVWGSNPQRYEVERQIREMHAKGIGGFIIDIPVHAQIDDNYNQCCLHAKDVALELGMNLHLHECDDSKANIAIKRCANTVIHNASFLDNISHFLNNSQTAIPEGRTDIKVFSDASGAENNTLEVSLATKFASSINHTKGIGRTVCNITSQADWPLSMKQIKHRADLCASLGANAFRPHPFHYSIVDALNETAPLSQFYQAAYWPQYKLLSNYITRLSYTLSQGRHKAAAALFYPNEVIQEKELFDEYFNLYAEYLLKEHIDYDIVDESALQKANSIDQRIFIEDEAYNLLIIPPIAEIRYETAVKIYEFGEDGGRILANVLLPFQEAGGSMHEGIATIFYDLFEKDPAQLYKDYLKAKLPKEPILSSTGSMIFLNTENPSSIVPIMRSIVSAAVKPEVSLKHNGRECHDITYIHRILSNSELYFFSNNASEPRDVQMSIRCSKAPYMLNLETGDATALPYCTQRGNRTLLLHRFEEYGSLLVYFSNDPAFAVAQEISTDGQDVPLSEKWMFSIEQPNCLSLYDWTYNILRQNEVSQCAYITSFIAETKPDKLLLVIENIQAEITVNGNRADDFHPYALDANFKSIDITPYVQTGRNEIRLLIQDDTTANRACTNFHGARLMGNFSLDKTNSKIQSPRSIICNGSWTDQGYPFFSGTASYMQRVMIPEFLRGQRVILQANNPADMVEFIVNGASAGVRAWAPYVQDITPLVKIGLNEIEIKVTNSSANTLLLQPRPSGLLGGVRLIIY